MLKYVDTLIGFQEVPDEISLCINISGCKNACPNCHSPYLAEDIGKDLDEDALVNLMCENKGITCVCLMGGDHEPEHINFLANIIKDMVNNGGWTPIKVAWYSGKQDLSPAIRLAWFDYIKLGPYKEEFGPLNKSTTNQRMFRIDHTPEKNFVVDITSKFWK